jgi:hypothetical protein
MTIYQGLGSYKGYTLAKSFRLQGSSDKIPGSCSCAKDVLNCTRISGPLYSTRTRSSRPHHLITGPMKQGNLRVRHMWAAQIIKFV